MGSLLLSFHKYFIYFVFVFFGECDPRCRRALMTFLLRNTLVIGSKQGMWVYICTCICMYDPPQPCNVRSLVHRTASLVILKLN